MPRLRILLVPFAFAYKLITDLRNHLYDIGNRKSITFDRFVISVGNLTVGGTGKTPFVELLVRQLKDSFQIAILSRGYRRNTRGYRLATKEDDANTIGDEPFQYFMKYGSEVAVAVGEESDTIEEVYEPYLIQEGFINRTPRGREATGLAYKHFNLSPAEGLQEKLL